jgi:hypothetical protein
MGRCRPGVRRNLCRQYLSRLKGYRFEISANLRQLGWIDAPHTQNFENLESLEQTQELKIFIISFEIFIKMLDGLNFGKRCLLGCSIWNFFQNQKILNLRLLKLGKSIRSLEKFKVDNLKKS